MNKIWENGKSPNFGLDFAPFTQNVDPKKFFRQIYLS